MKVLMLSSSRQGNEAYLEHAITMINNHLNGIKEVLFIPYAGVTISNDEYTQKVQGALPHLNIEGIHNFENPMDAIKKAKSIAVGGGNTFRLLDILYQQDLVGAIQQAVNKGTPYIGWSAGSNICGNSIRTTNDMPIVQPRSFNGLNFVPFQINPHYSDFQPPGHNGETRAQRIAEFCTLHPIMPVVGLKEGSALVREGNTLSLAGALEALMFKGNNIHTLPANTNLDFLLK